MKNNQYKQNFYKKEEKRLRRISRMKPEQKESYAKNLLSRIQRKAEIKEQIINILTSEKNLAIVDIQRKLGLNRNTFNYWINMFEKEGWFKRKTIECEGAEKRGQPKTLILNKRKIKEREQHLYRSKKSFEEGNLKNLITFKIVNEIEKQQPSDKQYERLVKLFKRFGKEGFGARYIFLLHSDLIKINYKLSITAKGKKYLKSFKKRKKI